MLWLGDVLPRMMTVACEKLSYQKQQYPQQQWKPDWEPQPPVSSAELSPVHHNRIRYPDTSGIHSG
jgi:hypothetical protein